MNLACVACERPGKVFVIEFDAFHKQRARSWRLRICQGCWRAFEAMLDAGAVSRQEDLLESGSAKWMWFV